MDKKEILQTKALFYFVGKGLEIVSKTNEDFQEEFEDLDGVFQWEVCETVKTYLIAKKGKFEVHLDATHEQPAVTFTVAEFDKARDILTGKIDGTSAYMAGDMNIMGDIQMGMKFAKVSEFLLEALSDLVS